MLMLPSGVLTPRLTSNMLMDMQQNRRQLLSHDSVFMQWPQGRNREVSRTQGAQQCTASIPQDSPLLPPPRRLHPCLFVCLLFLCFPAGSSQLTGPQSMGRTVGLWVHNPGDVIEVIIFNRQLSSKLVEPCQHNSAEFFIFCFQAQPQPVGCFVCHSCQRDYSGTLGENWAKLWFVSRTTWLHFGGQRSRSRSRWHCKFEILGKGGEIVATFPSTWVGAILGAKTTTAIWELLSLICLSREVSNLMEIQWLISISTLWYKVLKIIYLISISSVCSVTNDIFTVELLKDRFFSSFPSSPSLGVDTSKYLWKI